MANRNYTPNNIENPPPSPSGVLLRRELNDLPPISSRRCIFIVSESLRCGEDKAFTPQEVSIGPIHHGKEELKPMEVNKYRYLDYFLTLTNKNLDYYKEKIRENEELLRSYYAEPIVFTSDEFVKIVLVDAAFIIMVLLWFSKYLDDEHSWIFKNRGMSMGIFKDLLLLENQLPFFILKEFLETVSFADGGRLSINVLSYNLFKATMKIRETPDILKRVHSSNIVAHFVDFLRSLYVPLSGSGGKINTLTIPKMTELQRAGVKFKVGLSGNLFDLQFSKGILEIPKLTIVDDTELTLRNLLAFEQYHYNSRENYLNDYVTMMNCLVDTPEDVDFLVKNGIIENALGDNAKVSTLINKLAEGVPIYPDNFYFSRIFEELNDYCRTLWHKWKANLNLNYFNSPWATVSVIAAILLIILTIIQAVCSVVSVIR